MTLNTFGHMRSPPDLDHLLRTDSKLTFIQWADFWLAASLSMYCLFVLSQPANKRDYSTVFWLHLIVSSKT